MAINTNHLNSKLKIVFKTEPDADNKQFIKTRTINNPKPEADSETLYNFALEMSGLQKHTVLGIYKQDEYSLVKD